MAAGRLAGAIDGGNIVEVDRIESSSSRYRLLLFVSGNRALAIGVCNRGIN